MVTLSMLLSLPVIYILQRLRGRTFGDLGLRRPSKSWTQIIIVAVCLAVLIQVAEIALGRLFGPTMKPNLSVIDVSNPQSLLCWIAVGIIGGGFFEEFIFRGFLFSRGEMFFGRKPQSTIIAVILLTVVFGLLHNYQGLAGVIISALASLVFFRVYFWSKRNLWAPILTHSCVNIIGFLCIILGID